MPKSTKVAVMKVDGEEIAVPISDSTTEVDVEDTAQSLRDMVDSTSALGLDNVASLAKSALDQVVSGEIASNDIEIAKDD